MSDAWDDIGRHDLPDAPSVGGVPLCPMCGRNDATQLAPLSVGGLWCGHCNTTYAGSPGEWGDNSERRALWQREYERKVT